MRARHAIMVMSLLTDTMMPSEAGARRNQRNGQVAHLESLTLQRSCFCPRPEYTVTVEADGHIAFAGGRSAPVSKAEGQASASDLKALIAALNEVRFFSLNDQYETKADGCDGVAFDAPKVIVSAHADGRSKTVRHDHGCWKDIPKPAAA